MSCHRQIILPSRCRTTGNLASGLPSPASTRSSFKTSTTSSSLLIPNPPTTPSTASLRQANHNNTTTPPTSPTTQRHPSTRSPAAAADGSEDVVRTALVVNEENDGVEVVALLPEPPRALDPEGLGRSLESPVCCGVVLDIADVRSVWGSVLAELAELAPPELPEAWHLPSVVHVVPALQYPAPPGQQTP